MIARRISLFTGLYLFVFLFAHLVNLTLGLKSVDLMDQARGWLIAPWTNMVGGGLLLLCLFFHILLGLRALYLRNTLRLSPFDAFQLLLGLSIPLLLFPHIITLALLPALTDQHATYRQVLALFWIDKPILGLRQVIGLMVVWLHSCMGLFIWMRLQAWWRKVSLVVYPTVVLLPTLAMLGFVEAGKEVIASVEPTTSIYQSSPSSESQGADENKAGYDVGGSGYGDAKVSGGYSSGADGGDNSRSSSASQSAETSAAAGEAMQTLSRVVQMSVYGYLILLALVLAARALRLYPDRQQARIKIGTADEITTSSGANLLEISRLNGISHASLCGGKGRCGTCQVAIVSGQENLTPPTEVEARKLQQINAAKDIRLACQAGVTGGNVQLELVLPAFVVADDMPHRRAAVSPPTAPVAAAPTTAIVQDSFSDDNTLRDEDSTESSAAESGDQS